MNSVTHFVVAFFSMMAGMMGGACGCEGIKEEIGVVRTVANKLANYDHDQQ